jgi:hypothetical protein
MTASHQHRKVPAAFWRWFSASEARFRAVSGPDSETLLDELHGHLQDFCSDLYFEIGGAPNGPVELVISAGGNRSVFPCVRELVALAPQLPGWHFIAFKQPQGFDFTTERNGVVLDPRECVCQLVPDLSRGTRHWLRVACPGFLPSAAKDYAFAVWTALDSAMGEVFVAEHILDIDLCPMPIGSRARAYFPLTSLPLLLAPTGCDV